MYEKEQQSKHTVPLNSFSFSTNLTWTWTVTFKHVILVTTRTLRPDFCCCSLSNLFAKAQNNQFNLQVLTELFSVSVLEISMTLVQ